MPLVRVEVRNEYRLGKTELYKEAAEGEDPKAVLDGVAVAGLVGILRQLGDLAEFAAEIFHGVQEQVMITSSRSHKLMVRVRHIEAALPPLEKTILGQKSHLHFAYTTGSNWHAHVPTEENHFIYNDLPRFIMDSYEECRSPPRLHLLDKFDNGGPGSCLKRYSDPTFFKRASAKSNEAKVDKFLRDKKARRIKKKRSWQRNEEVSHGASMSNYSGSLPFASLNVDDQISPTQTDSTFDTTMKSDLGDQSNSFDYTIGSGYIECVFHPSDSRKPEEQECRESSSSQLPIYHNETVDYAFLDEESRVVDDDIQNSLSQEQTGQRSSCVTWDEKTEIVEPSGQQYDHDESSEILPTNSDPNTEETGTVHFRTMEQMDLESDDENMPTLICSGEKFDDIESETENYMDALNTIESESETDFDCQTKRELEQYSNLNNRAVENGINGLAAQNLECHTSNFESHIAGYSSPNKDISRDIPNSVSPESHTPVQPSSNLGTSEDRTNSVSTECYVHIQSPQTAGNSLALDSLPDIDLCGNANTHDVPNSEFSLSHGSSSGSREHTLPNIDLCGNANTRDGPSSEFSLSNGSSSGSREHTLPNIGLCGNAYTYDGPSSEFSLSNGSSSGSRECTIQDPVSEKIISSFCESQGHPPEASSVNMVKFWTNGGLLGLEPSKPPDSSSLKAVSHDTAAKNKNDQIDPLIQSNILVGNGPTGKPDILDKSCRTIEEGPSSECSATCHNDQEDGVSMKRTPLKFSPADLVVKVETSKEHSNSFNHFRGPGFDDTSIFTSGTKRPIIPDVQSTKASEENGKDSSRMFEFSNRSLVNGFRRTLSLGGDNTSEPASSLNTGVSESRHQSAPYQTFSGRTKEQFGSAYPTLSPSSSPPLEHMKISFQPIDGSETSKLKLRFPNGSNCCESSRDMFPSFQLVPEPDIPDHDFGSDSDDDTFCRSSPYMSDDCLSSHSDSNSEHWESGQSPSTHDHELYDALRGISPAESDSISLEVGQTAHGVVSDSYGFRSPFAENGAELSQSGCLLDLPSLDITNTSSKQESENNSHEKDLLGFPSPKEPTPLPPPLPPLEWRSTRPLSDVAEDIQDSASVSFSYTSDLKLSRSSISQQPKPAPIKQDQIIEVAYAPKSKQPDREKLNGQKEVYQHDLQALNGQREGMDEKEDFLQQIRTKSFSLRRTVTTKPTHTLDPPSNVSVTAILKKANAIRQAVGSDNDDEDDKWSDV